MDHARIDITQGLDGEAVVLAVFDLGEEEISASAHAVKVITAERFRNVEMSIDDVLELRELTALADELADLVPARHAHARHAPGRLNAWRDALTHFVESRDEAEWTREEDRKPLPARPRRCCGRWATCAPTRCAPRLPRPRALTKPPLRHPIPPTRCGARACIMKPPSEPSAIIRNPSAIAAGT